MLKITSAQMAVFGRASEHHFFVKRAEHLPSRFAENLRTYGVGDQEIFDFVRYGMQRARSWGVEYREDISLFLETMMLLGPQFDEDPAIPEVRRILEAPSYRGDEKMEQIEDFLLFGDGPPR